MPKTMRPKRSGKSTTKAKQGAKTAKAAKTAKPAKPAKAAKPTKTAKPAKTAKAPARKPAGVDFNLEARLAALPAATADTQPRMPVVTMTHEAERLWGAAKSKRGLFIALPDFDPRDFDDVPHLIVALSDLERRWQRVRLGARADGLVATRAEGESLRARVLKEGRYLLRKNAAALLEIDRITEGEGLADLVTDLRDCADLVTDHAAVFERAKKLESPGKVAADLRRLATRLAEGVETEEAGALLALRNRAFVALDNALTELRAGARYLYDDQPRTLAPYLSGYDAAKKRAARAASRKAKKPDNKPGDKPDSAAPGEN